MHGETGQLTGVGDLLGDSEGSQLAASITEPPPIAR
jgi:hypothetical protein